MNLIDDISLPAVMVKILCGCILAGLLVLFQLRETEIYYLIHSRPLPALRNPIKKC